METPAQKNKRINCRGLDQLLLPLWIFQLHQTAVWSTFRRIMEKVMNTSRRALYQRNKRSQRGSDHLTRWTLTTLITIQRTFAVWLLRSTIWVPMPSHNSTLLVTTISPRSTTFSLWTELATLPMELEKLLSSLILHLSQNRNSRQASHLPAVVLEPPTL